MVNSRRFSMLGVALCLAATGSTVTSPARTMAAAPAAPRVVVVGHVSTYLVYQFTNPDRDVIGHRLTLRISGSDFLPGAMVRIAVINTSSWKVLARDVTFAQPAPRTWKCRNHSHLCAQAEGATGSIDDRFHFRPAPAAHNLLVLYRYAGDPGVSPVALR
jgi:hypothetical protein